MTEQQDKDGDVLRDALTRALVTEAVSLSVILVAFWAVRNEATIRNGFRKARMRFRKRADDGYGRAIWEVRRDISRMERGET